MLDHGRGFLELHCVAAVNHGRHSTEDAACRTNTSFLVMSCPLAESGVYYLYRVVASSCRTPPVELRHLRYLVAIADAGSFSRAAEVLRVAQPALTRQIHDLEAELGV